MIICSTRKFIRFLSLMKSTLEIGTELTTTKEAAKIVSHKKGIANISSVLQKFSFSCFQVPICNITFLIVLQYMMLRDYLHEKLTFINNHEWNCKDETRFLSRTIIDYINNMDHHHPFTSWNKLKTLHIIHEFHLEIISHSLK